MNEQKRKRFEETLTKAFDHDRYVQFLKELLDNMQIVAPNKEIKPYNTFSAAIDHYRHIGNYTGEDKSKVALFSVCLKNDKNLENARSMQRAFVKTLLENSNCAGALVAFYTADDLDKWRLSLVRMDYEFSKGKLSAKLTPAKRYSYLVGDGEPCHTAQERLYPIFVADDLDPSLDELEEAFSVEAVTKDFFDQYREKYLDLKEFLDSNPEFIAEAESRGFDSEQFAKKLMGQIVFLYFIQKKGWLGVNAFPFKLTEREYKSGFYRSGRKPKELMPLVYKQRADGFFYRDNHALLSLSPEDETTLSTLVKGDAWGDGPKDFMRQIFEGCKNAGKNFFDDYLEPLFYTGLNQNRGDNAFFPPLHRRIPFMNGGLFEEMEGYDWRNNDFRIPNELFSNADVKGKRNADGILDVFDRYNFTMAEDEPMEREVAIDPEMLGKVFENLLDVTDRKSKGAFYTPREIVHYMCQESLINYLSTKTGISDSDIRKFILYGEYFRDEDTRKTLPIDNETGKVLEGDEIYFRKHHMEYDKTRDLEIPASIFSYKNNVNRLVEIDNLLANVKVVDPAVGSGAFPLGMLNEIVKARETITAYMIIDMNGYQRLSYRSMRNSYRMKRETIKNSIFACDIEASATDITKLRLWLSLVIDNQIMDQENDEFGYTTKPRELPNLDCNIICGNSLVDEFEGVPLITENAALKNESQGRQMTTFDHNIGVLITELIDLQSKLYDEKDHIAKEALKDQIQDIYNQIVMEQISGNNKIVDDYYQAIQLPSKPFVLWQLYFPKVFRDNGGFDIAIGNPPYGVKYNNIDKAFLKNRYTYSIKGKFESYRIFMEFSEEITTPDATLSFVVPNTWMSVEQAVNLRKQWLENNSFCSIIQFPQKSFNATVDTIAYVVQKGKSTERDTTVCIVPLYEDPSHISNYLLNTFSMSQMTWYNSPKHLIIFGSDATKRELIDKVKSGNKELGDVIITKQGLIPYLTKEEGKENKYISEYKKDESWSKYFDGSRCIDRYGTKGKLSYIQYGDWLYAPREQAIFCQPRIVFQLIRNISLRQRIVATYIEEEIYSDRNTGIILPKSEEVSLKYILGLMNSKLYNFIHANTHQSTYISFPSIEALPYIEGNAEDTGRIIELVSEILQQKKSGNDTSELEEEIDKIVYQLTDLNEEEIHLVEEQ